MPGQNWILLYILLTAPFSIVLFLYGFFPIVYHADAIASQSDVPDHIGDLSVKKHTLYKPMITKLIIMIIDGLRWDFVAGQIGKVAMPMTNSLLTNSSGCLLQAKLQSPTVTMPRIKAMMTGTMPNFIDIVLNFGSKALNSDSLLLQAQRNGYKLIFYGDDTWLSLFPQIFDRHDGTTSFFVTDFTEVDNNVTRHLQDELNRDDWTVMILHYLGLDHIGHVEGPFGASIKPKLQEMDKIVSQIAQRVQDLNNNGTPVLFVVCGDHGMKDSGGHGGSTPEETTVPFIAIGGTRCSPQKENKTVEIEQLDIAATLSTVLGLPIPSTNLGSTFLDSIYDLDDAKRLFLLYYNSKQMFDRFQKQEQQSQKGSQIFTTTTVTNGSYDTVQSLDSQSTVFTKNQRSNGVKSKRKRSGAQRKKKKKAALSNLVFNFSAPSTSLQPIANTSGIGIKRLRSCMDSFEMNNYTKKIKLFHEKTQTEDDDSLTGAIVSMNIPLGLEQLILFRSAILKEIDKIIEGPMPKFHGSYIKLGAIVVKCADKASLHWLSMQITNISPWPSTMFKMISLNELHTYFRATVWIPSPLESTAIVLQRLQRQNPSLDTASWRIYSENLKTFEEGRTLFLGMPKLDFEKLQASNFKAYLGLEQINFIFNI